MENELLTAQDLDFSLGGKKILSGISFSFPQKSLVGILGPNGSGKTTLLRLLCRYWKPGEGELSWRGKAYSHYSLESWARFTSYLPQNLPEGLPMPVEDFLLLGLYPTISERRWLARDRGRFEELVKRFELEAIRNRRLGDLSAGEIRRVFIAGGLINEPEIYLLDEPNNGLDWRHHEGIFRELQNYQKNRGATLVMSLHDVNLAARLCDHILLLGADGTLQHFGPTPEVMTLPYLQKVYGVAFKKVTSDDGKEEWFLH